MADTKYTNTDDKLKNINETNQPPSYALYRYHANRPKEKSNDTQVTVKNESSVADFLQKEATLDGNFSLSVVVTSLDTEHEAGLRNFIARKLSKGTMYSGSSNLANFDLSPQEDSDIESSMLCYYCLLRQDMLDFLEESSKEDDPRGESTYCSSEFVVCFLIQGDMALDLFRKELDSYSQGLLQLLNADPSGIEAIAKPYLENWREEVMYYICRCVEKFGEDVKYLIHAALVDKEVEIKCQDEHLRKDIKRFIKCCSLSELLSQVQTENTLINITLEKIEAPFPKEQTKKLLIVKVEDDTHKFESEDCTHFCDEWARSFMSGDVKNPLFLKQVIENYKLKAIQDMNTLKRLIRQAETDHYALYRSYVFLKKCGNGSILLQHARLEHPSLVSDDSQNVLRVLHDFVEKFGGLSVFK